MVIVCSNGGGRLSAAALGGVFSLFEKRETLLMHACTSASRVAGRRHSVTLHIRRASMNRFIQNLRAFRLCRTVLALGAAVVISGVVGYAYGLGWSDLRVRLLPDESFAKVEHIDGGKKIKHCPHHDNSGDLDIEQLIFVVGTFENEKWQETKNKRLARKHLQNHYDTLIKRLRREGLRDKININRAKLSDLVRLPHIGPSLAVKIIHYRETHSRFGSIEELKVIDGIGSETFNAIRYYVKI